MRTAVGSADSNGSCPNCGFCPNCGRRNAPAMPMPYTPPSVVPVYPWTQPTPFYPWTPSPVIWGGTPYQTTTISATGGNSNSALR